MKKRYKIMIAACSAFTLISGTALALTSGPGIYINKAGYASSYFKLKVENGTSMVSLREIVETLKGEVTYKDNNIYVSLPEASHLSHQVNGYLSGLEAETPEEAVRTWIRGVQRRSGPLQYAVMTPAMQKTTKAEFEDDFWVTGGSSPHMGPVDKLTSKTLTAGKVQITFDYPLIAQTQTIATGKALIIVEKDDDPIYERWAISDIYLQDPGDTGITVGVKPMSDAPNP